MVNDFKWGGYHGYGRYGFTLYITSSIAVFISERNEQGGAQCFRAVNVTQNEIPPSFPLLTAGCS